MKRLISTVTVAALSVLGVVGVETSAQATPTEFAVDGAFANNIDKRVNLKVDLAYSFIWGTLTISDNPNSINGFFHDDGTRDLIFASNLVNDISYSANVHQIANSNDDPAKAVVAADVWASPNHAGTRFNLYYPGTDAIRSVFIDGTEYAAARNASLANQSNPAKAAILNDFDPIPNKIAVDGSDNTYVASNGTYPLVKFNADGSLDSAWTTEFEQTVTSGCSIGAISQFTSGGNDSVIYTCAGHETFYWVNTSGTSGPVAEFAGHATHSFGAEVNFIFNSGLSGLYVGSKKTSSSVNALAKLNSDGTMNTEFNTNLGDAFKNTVSVESMAIGFLGDAVVLTSGSASAGISELEKMTVVGVRDLAFSAATQGKFITHPKTFSMSFDCTHGTNNLTVGCIYVPQSRQSIYGIGQQAVQGSGITFINSAGNVVADRTLAASPAFQGTIMGVKATSEGKFIAIDSVGYVTRLNADGTVDPTYGVAGGIQPFTGFDRNFDGPFPIAMDSTDRIVFAERDLGDTVRINANGTLDTTWGTNGYQNLGRYIQYLGFDSSDLLYVSSSPVINTGWKFRRIFTNTANGHTPGQVDPNFTVLNKVALDAYFDEYTIKVALEDGTVVRLRRSNGASDTAWGGRASPEGVSKADVEGIMTTARFDSDGNAFMVRGGQGTIIKKISPNGLFDGVWNANYAANSTKNIDGSRYLAFDSAGRLYVAEDSDRSMRIYNQDGTAFTSPVPPTSGCSQSYCGSATAIEYLNGKMVYAATGLNGVGVYEPNTLKLFNATNGTAVVAPGAPTTVALSATATPGDLSVVVTDSTSGGTASDYVVQTKATGNLWVDQVGPFTSSSFTLSLTAGVTYTVKVAARNLAGSSDFTTSSSSVATYAIPSNPPSAPVIVAVAAGTDPGVVNIEASSGVGGGAVTDYVVKTLDVTTNANATNWAIDVTHHGPAAFSVTLLPGHIYKVAVAASNSAGQSAFTTWPNSITTIPNAPSQPVSVTLAKTKKAGELKVTVVNGLGGGAIDHYAIQVKQDAPNTEWIQAINKSANPFVLSGLQPGVAYFVQVAEGNSGGTSEYTSSAASETTALFDTVESSDTDVENDQKDTITEQGDLLVVPGTRKFSGLDITINNSAQLIVKVSSMYTGPIKGTATFSYVDNAVAKTYKCSFASFGGKKALKLKANKVKAKRSYKSLPCANKSQKVLPTAGIAAIATGPASIVVALTWDRRWPTTYKAFNPVKKKKIKKQKRTITVRLGTHNTPPI